MKRVQVQSALAAGRKKGSSFQARYHSLKGRIGPKKAAIATAAALLRVVHHMLKDGTFYQDLGTDHRRERNPERAATRPAERIRAKGLRGRHPTSPRRMIRQVSGERGKSPEARAISPSGSGWSVLTSRMSSPPRSRIASMLHG